MLKQHLRLQKSNCKNFWRLGNKEEKAMLLVMSRSDVQFRFEHAFFCVLNGAPRKKLRVIMKGLRKFTKMISAFLIKKYYTNRTLQNIKTD